MPKLTYGQRLRKLRENARDVRIGLTQAELAERAGLSKQQIHQWENDQRRPSEESARKLAKALGVGVDELGEP